jgi:hypothetical protein
MAHPDLAAEQAYVDHAYECLDGMRESILRSAGAAATEVAAEAIEAWAIRRLRSYEDAEHGLCFGRLDLDAAEDPLYVGRRWVDDDDGAVVVNWQARLRAPSTRRRRPSRTASPSAAAFARTGVSSRESATRLSTDRSPKPRLWSTTFSSRSSNGRATPACATSSQRSRPTSTA